MKRFHVHAQVADLEASIAFYSKLFGAAPVRVEADYAKWMLDDPRVNFAISARGGTPGIDHLGIQAESSDELAELKSRAAAVEPALRDEGQTSCCYARSTKHWITDPQGIAWEHFQTLQDIPVFREAPATEAPVAAACGGRPRGKPVPVAIAGAASTTSSSCC